MAVLLCERGQLPQFTTSTRTKSDGSQTCWLGDYRDSGFVHQPDPAGCNCCPIYPQDFAAFRLRFTRVGNVNSGECREWRKTLCVWPLSSVAFDRKLLGLACIIIGKQFHWRRMQAIDLV